MRSGSPLGRREGVDEDRLSDRSKAASADALNDSEKQHEAEGWRQPAEQRRHCEQEDAEQVVVLAPNQVAEPCRHGKDDGVRHEVCGEDPGHFVIAAPQAAADVGESHVGDGSIEQFHEGRDCDCAGDEPRVYGAW